MGLLSKWVESLDYEYEILSSCTRHRSPHSTCQKCLTACRDQAISIMKGKPVLDSDKCVQCGRCMAACPVQAIAGIHPQRTIIQNQLVISGQCIPTSKELLILYKKGINSIICEEEASLLLWKEPIEEANTSLRILGEAPFSISVVKSIRQEELYSRREIFTFWKKESKTLLQQFTPAKWRFNNNSFDLTKHYSDYQFAQISLNIEKCTLCGVCQRLCEKMCIEIQKEHYSINLQGCTSCQLCEDTCPEKAIMVDDKILKAAETAFPIYEKVCRVCNQTFRTLREQDDECVACTKREELLSQLN
jgi:ferredoxin